MLCGMRAAFQQMNESSFPLFGTQILGAPVDLQDEGLGIFAVCFFTKLDDRDREKHTEQIPEQLFLPRILFF